MFFLERVVMTAQGGLRPRSWEGFVGRRFGGIGGSPAGGNEHRGEQ